VSFLCEGETVFYSCVVTDDAVFFDLDLFSDVDAFADYCAFDQSEVGYGYVWEEDAVDDADVVANYGVGSDDCVGSHGAVFAD